MNDNMLALEIARRILATPEGGTMYRNGDEFAPITPTYVVGGLSTTKIYWSGKIEPVHLAEIVFSVLTDPDAHNATTIGWWLHEGCLYIDAGEFYHTMDHSMSRILKIASDRGELAVGLFNDGKYVTELYV